MIIILDPVSIVGMRRILLGRRKGVERGNQRTEGCWILKESRGPAL